MDPVRWGVSLEARVDVEEEGKDGTIDRAWNFLFLSLPNAGTEGGSYHWYLASTMVSSYCWAA